MVLISNIWMTHTLQKAVTTARENNMITPNFIKKYVDDIFSIFDIQPNYRGDAIEDFRMCLNSVHPRVQFTVENEKNAEIPFLDCLIRRLTNGRITTSVYRKPTETDVITKSNSCHDPKILLGAFKTSLCRAHRVCSTPDFFF
jgi:hypothetical protein